MNNHDDERQYDVQYCAKELGLPLDLYMLIREAVERRGTTGFINSALEPRHIDKRRWRDKRRQLPLY